MVYNYAAEMREIITKEKPMDIQQSNMMTVNISDVNHSQMWSLMNQAKPSFKEVDSTGNIFHVDFMSEFPVLAPLVEQMEAYGAIYLYVKRDENDSA